MIRTTSILFWFSLIIFASLGLYRTSDRVQELDRQLHDTNAAIDAEKQSLHVLKAEWVYLTNPARIAAITKKHLTLRPTVPAQVATMDNLGNMLPARGESNVAVNAAPMANVRGSLPAKVAAAQPAILSHASKPRVITVAAADTGHVRDHMILVQHTASAAPLPGDSIRALISELGAGR